MDFTPEKLLELCERIHADFGYRVHLCGEIEWLFAYDAAVPDALFTAILEAARAENIALESVGRENTHCSHIQQYEFRFRATPPLEAAEALYWLDATLTRFSEAFAIPIWREAWHVPQQESAQEQAQDIAVLGAPICSGLHWHMHLTDSEENYVFIKQDKSMSPPLEHSLAGLLFTMPALMPCFAPFEASYARLHSGADHVPSKICWGANNRTAALRMPESVIPLRHIEHRICGADVDYLISAWAVVAGIHYGLTHRPELIQQCYGDARRAGEAFASLPESLEASLALWNDAAWLEDYRG